MLSASEIKRFIDDDISSEKKRQAKLGLQYYEGRHEILNKRLFYFDEEGNLHEDKYRSNIKISHPFFTELSDQLSAYMLSFKENPIRAKANAEGLQKHLDTYFDDEFWAEIGELITNTYNLGFGYMYTFKNADDRLAFQCADSMGVVEVREKDTDDGCKYVIYWYTDRILKGKKPIKKIQVWTEKETHYFVQSGKSGKIEKDTSIAINPRPHVVYTDEKTNQKMGYGLGYIPFWRMDNNKKQISGLKAIKGIIDDYDLHACSLSNNLADFDTPLHVVSGFQGDNLDELQTNLKTKKLVGVGEGGGVTVETVDIPYQARQAKLELDEKNIYRFGMGLNTSGLKDTAATTNIAIKAAYSLLDMKANKMETRLRKLLKEIIKVVLKEINDVNGTDYKLTDIEFFFERSVMTNETENIANAKTEADTKQVEVNTILNVAASVGDEQTLKAICEVMDWDFDELQGQVEQMQEEQALATAQGALDAVVPEDEITIPEGIQ